MRAANVLYHVDRTRRDSDTYLDFTLVGQSHGDRMLREDGRELQEGALRCAQHREPVVAHGGVGRRERKCIRPRADQHLAAFDERQHVPGTQHGVALLQVGAAVASALCRRFCHVGALVARLEHLEHRMP